MKLGCDFRSAIARRILFFDGFAVVIRILSTPLAAIASASLSLAQQIPIDPVASWYLAIAAHLCVFACGRLGRPNVFSAACIVATFFSILSRSTHSAGVSSSHFDTPGFTVPATVMARISAAVYPFTGFGIQRNAEAAPAAERKERRDEPMGREGISVSVMVSGS